MRFRFLLCAATLVVYLPAQAQPRLQDADIDAHDGTIKITHMPVVLPDGRKVFRDVTIELGTDASGSIRFAPDAKPISRPTPPFVAPHFLAGTYRRSGEGGGIITVTNRGNAFGAEYPSWSLQAAGGGAGSVLSSASWFAGPLDSHPRRRQLKDIGLISEAYSYGASDGGGAEGYEAGAILGFTQAGNVLTITSFRRGCCSNSSKPVSQISYTFIGE